MRRKDRRPLEPRTRLRVLDVEKKARLLDKATEPLRSLVLVGIHTGLRIKAEALTLRWDSVNLRGGISNSRSRVCQERVVREQSRWTTSGWIVWSSERLPEASMCSLGKMERPISQSLRSSDGLASGLTFWR